MIFRHPINSLRKRGHVNIKLLLISVSVGLLFQHASADSLSIEKPDMASDGVRTATPASQDTARVEPDSSAPPYPDVKVSLPGGVLFGTFTKEDGPFLISDNVIVPSGQVLEFGPACTLYVGGEYTTITVFGQLFARGTEEEPVVFMSAKRRPQPWDWDRIYCRSRNRSLFEHCIISHSNYGVYVENGSASISNCYFKRNSLNGVAVKNGDITITTTRFSGGHVIALSLLPGAVVNADSLTITENITGISCADKSTLKLRGGAISSNSNGLIAARHSSIDIVAAEICRNKNGVIAELPIPKKTREMVYDNNLDVKIATAEEMKKLLKEPQPVTSIVLPKAGTAAKISDDFKAGFSAMSIPREATTSFIGNVKTGFSFFMPRSSHHPKDFDTTETYQTRSDSTIDTVRTIKKVMNRQTKYPGEQSDTWYSGIQPELQFFANGRRGDADINLLMDMYGNQWLSTTNYLGKNMFNLAMNYSHQSVVIGDFFESGSETSIPGRQMTGIRYSGKYFEMGRGEKRLVFKLAAGETEIAKDSGDHEIFVYNQTVDTGMSKRQQITYLAEATLKPTRLSSVTARGIIAHDQTGKPLFRKSLSDPAAVDPVSAQTGCISGNIFLLNQKLELYSEIDMGSADTLSDSTADKIAWYNPQVEKAVPKVFSLFNSEDFMQHYAVSGGMRGNFNGYKGNIRYLQIAPNYYSAGDPYMVNWRKNGLLSIGRQILDNLELTGSYEFDRTSLPGYGEDNTPTVTDLNIFSIESGYEMGEGKPAFSLNYTLQHKKNDARESVVHEDTSYSEDFDELEFSNRVSLEGKQRITTAMSYSLRYQLLWDKDYSDHPDEDLQNEGDRFHNGLSGWFTVRVKRKLRNKISLRVATKHENRDSLRAYQIKVGDQLSYQIIPRKLSCSVSGEYMYKQEKEFGDDEWLSPLLTTFYNGGLEVKYSLTSRLSCSVKGKYEKSYDEITGSSENYTASIFGLHLTYLF